MLQPQRQIVAAQRIGLADRVSGFVVAVLKATALRIGGTEQLAFVVPFEQPCVVQVIAVADDLVLCVPMSGADAL